MSDKKMKLSQEELEMIEEVEHFMEEVKNDPDVANAPLPSKLRENIFREISAREDAKTAQVTARLSARENELILLGTIYERKRRKGKYLVLAAAMVLTLAFGITSMGEVEKIFSNMHWMIGDREQENVNSEDIEPVRYVTEEEAYEEIEDKYGFYPVKLDYLPEGIGFLEAKIGEKIQDVQMIYGTDQETKIAYHIRPNYRVSSWGKDIKDELLEEYEMQVDDTEIYLKKYRIEDDSERWLIGFEHDNVSYSLLIMNMDKVEVEKIVKNLFFF